MTKKPKGKKKRNTKKPTVPTKHPRRKRRIEPGEDAQIHQNIYGT